MKGLNRGWLLSLTAWLVNAIICPVLPEIIGRYKSGWLTYRIFPDLATLEFLVTIAFFAGILAIFWIPLTFISGSIYKNKGYKPARNFVLAAFLVLVVIYSVLIVFIYFFT